MSMFMRLPCLRVGAPSVSSLPPQRSVCAHPQHSARLSAAHRGVRPSAARRGIRRPLVARRALACT